jgi:hemolysin D
MSMEGETQEASEADRGAVVVREPVPTPVKPHVPAELLRFFSPATAVMAMPPKRTARWITLVVGTLVFGVSLLFATMNVDRVVTGTGKVISLTDPIVVMPFNNAIVKTIAVSKGDIVRKGQLLAQLDPTYAAADEKAAAEQVDRYRTEIERLTDELHGQPYAPRTLSQGALVQEGIYAQRKAARDAELRYYQGQIDAQKALVRQAQDAVRQYARETGVAADAETMRERLESKLVGSRLSTLAAQQARVDLERQVLGSIEQGKSAQESVNSLQGQLDNYNHQWFADIAQNITDDSVQLANYQDQLSHSTLNKQLVDLRAPEDGIVLNVSKISVGSVIMAGQVFFELTPINAPLEIQTQVLGDESGFLQPGQPAVIKFEAFPYNNFGVAHGVVRVISPDSFLTSSTLQSMQATQTGSTGPSGGSAATVGDSVFTGQIPTSPYYYDVRVSLDRVKLHDVPKDFHVVPGMPVTTDVVIGRRTIMDYLMERLVPIFSSGDREPA